MGRKIFVSYKYKDNNIAPLEDEYKVDNRFIARSYVDYLIDFFKEDEIYKGEKDEDLSEFKDDTIKNRLKEKIHDSSITLILISPNMKEMDKSESEQWIPWEISYSLKEIIKNDKMSHTNGIIAVVLPDKNKSYEYYIQENSCIICNCRSLITDKLFNILNKNMFNIKEPKKNSCCGSHFGEPSYILSVRWRDFISDKDKYIDRANRN